MHSSEKSKEASPAWNVPRFVFGWLPGDGAVKLSVALDQYYNGLLPYNIRQVGRLTACFLPEEQAGHSLGGVSCALPLFVPPAWLETSG